MDAAPAQDTRESGFSLVEVVVAMVLVALTAVAFLPLAIHTTAGAATSSTLATATRLVSKQMEQVRATQLTVCPTLGPEPLGQAVGTPVDAGRGARLQTWTKFTGACVDGHGLLHYVVTVTDESSPGAPPVTTATTLVTVRPL